MVTVPSTSGIVNTCWGTGGENHAIRLSNIIHQSLEHSQSGGLTAITSLLALGSERSGTASNDCSGNLIDREIVRASTKSAGTWDGVPRRSSNALTSSQTMALLACSVRTITLLAFLMYREGMNCSSTHLFTK